MKIKPFFKWYDFWIGVYIDTKERAVYICPIPMFGVKIWRYSFSREFFKAVNEAREKWPK
jgi:hypothetical protein